MAVYHEGTVRGVDPDEFNPEESAKRLRKAMEKLGTDEKEIIDILSEHNNYQRQVIKSTYKHVTDGRDLVEDLESELSGHFEDVCIGLMMTKNCFDAYCLRRAMKRLGTNEIILTDILVARSNEEIQTIKKVYKNDLYQVDLEEHVKSETSGEYQRVLLGLLQGCRDQTQYLDQILIQRDVQNLKENGFDTQGREETIFTSILVQRSIPHLREIFERYSKLETEILSKTSGDLQKAYLSIVQFVKDPLQYYAKCLFESFDGPGTNDDRLIQLIVSHCEVDLKDIALVYQRLYQQSLFDAIKSECRGDYGRLMLKLSSSNDAGVSESSDIKG